MKRRKARHDGWSEAGAIHVFKRNVPDLVKKREHELNERTEELIFQEELGKHDGGGKQYGEILQ